MINDLYTAERSLVGDIPWNAYPRPQMRRDEWLSLNGTWDYFSEPGKEKRRILVPFCPESLLSGIHEKYPKGACLTYSRSFSVPDNWKGKHLLLHFGAADQEAEVFINGRHAVSHTGGYLPFSCDITAYIKYTGENIIEVKVTDLLNHKYPWGKQKNERGGMWYTPVSGIWQSVWLECVPEQHIHSLEITTDLSTATIKCTGVRDGCILLQGKEYPLKAGCVTMNVENPVPWTPDTPYLYHFSVVTEHDRVESYFALRTVSVRKINGKMRVCLNGKPYFFHALLDQGYWSDGLYTPAVPECYEKDILSAKALGFNTLRKHIKIEPQQFYYDCDRLGMIVFQDMVNNGDYSFLRDTALPTAGITGISDRFLNRNQEARRIFLDSMLETAELLGNHPCICVWTIFNEGWGQFCGDDAYTLLHKKDPFRLIDTASGWFRVKNSDFESKHIYFKKLSIGCLSLPQLLSEYGGYSFKLPEHSFNLEKTYGYRKYSDEKEFTEALCALFDRVVSLARDGLCGSVYTQLSDVEDETNGFLTFDRRKCKVSPGVLKKYEALLQEAVRE